LYFYVPKRERERARARARERERERERKKEKKVRAIIFLNRPGQNEKSELYLKERQRVEF
jgi:hypothetical protein